MLAGQDAAREAGDICVFVQSVPRCGHPTQHDALAGVPAGCIGTSEAGAASQSGDVHVELPPPVEVTPGDLAWWAPN